ncbi:MAG TPA: FAD/NAD(P)-binding protein [Armatimonadota bacterium]|jgi:NAD(P)H-flavin reductase
MTGHHLLHKDVYLPQSATIVRTEMMTTLDRYFAIRLDSGQQLRHMPGQFIGVSVPGIGEAPISLSSSPDIDEHFEIVVRKIGRVTDALHALKPGDRVGIRGPFGTEFPVDDDFKGKDMLFVCGGIGLVPLRSAIQYVLNRREQYQDVAILFGTRTPADRLFLPELSAWAARTDVLLQETVDRADDGWHGHVGVITALLPKVNINPVTTRVAICGPPILYKFVINALVANGLPLEHIYVSLERRMKCGVGKCGHCQINGLYTCLDGPVFNYSRLADVPEAI